MSWQSIITAPRDGTFILAGWHEGFDFGYDFNMKPAMWCEESREWMDVNADTWILGFPTHWMPLPDPPQ